MPAPIRRQPTSEDFSRVIDILSFEEFEIPRSQPISSFLDFPGYLAQQLDAYADYYTNCIKPYVDEVTLYEGGAEAPIEAKIKILTDGIKDTLTSYYKGKTFQAAQKFQDTLDAVGFIGLASVETFQPNRIFYRARYSSKRHLAPKELFHNPFENRGIVATSRYSIPGLPALYLGDSTYVCWEELNQQDYRNLFFSKFRNDEPLKVVKIQRLPDFINQLETRNVDHFERMTYLSRYLSLFPLTIACCIRTKENSGHFKPEYVIPQFLLQYVTDKDKKDAAGIMYPSAKVNYHQIQDVAAYNYVFPIKDPQPWGYCSDLVNSFSLTDPTSLELENLANFDARRGLNEQERHEYFSRPRRIAVANGVGRAYLTTAFGFIERVLNEYEPAKLDSPMRG